MKEKKNICFFYSSSQIEFIENGEAFNDGEFADQKKALIFMLNQLDQSGDNWQYYLRLHPLNPKYRDSGDELKYWDEIKSYPNLQIIPPESSIDSYALGSKATLTAHFGSTIGAEILYFELAPVVSLRKMPWSKNYNEGLLNTEVNVIRYLKEKNFKLFPKELTFPFAIFMNFGGSKFTFVTKDKLGNYKYFNKQMILKI